MGQRLKRVGVRGPWSSIGLDHIGWGDWNVRPIPPHAARLGPPQLFAALHPCVSTRIPEPVASSFGRSESIFASDFARECHLIQEQPYVIADSLSRRPQKIPAKWNRAGGPRRH